MSISPAAILSLLGSKPSQPPPQAPPPGPDATIGLDPETMLKAEQAFSGGPNPQLGQSLDSPAPATQPPPFVPDQPVPPPVATAPATPSAAPGASVAGLGDQTLPMEPAPGAAAPPPGAPSGSDATLPMGSEAAGAPAPLGAPPAPPAFTGDPAKDSQNNLDYHRAVTTWQQQAQAHGADLAAKQNALNQKKADRELALEQNAATIRNDEAKRFAQERQQRQQAIDKAVSDKADAYQSLTKGNGFLDQSLGDKIMGAIIFMLGSRQQALMNVANIQSGHAPTAQNEGLNYINKLMETRYQQKKDRLAAANDAILEARYGFKDALDNHHAAQADLDSDVAANYRLAAKEVASQAAQLGDEQSRQAALAAQGELLKKSAEYEGKMLQDQATLQEKREAAGATNKLAEAHLNLAERQATATENQHKETNAEARERIRLAEREAAIRDADRKQAMEDRKRGQELKVTESEEARTYRDPDTGQPVGLAPTARQVTVLADKATAGRQYAQALRGYADEIDADGRTLPEIPLVGNVTEASRRRDEAQARVLALGRKAQEVGVSNANIELEHKQAGSSGKGLTALPSSKILREMADKADQKVNEVLRSSLTPIKHGGIAPQEPSGTAPATGPRTGGKAKSGFDAPGGVRYELGDDGNYHKVK